MHTSNIDPKQIGYSWVPAGIVTSSKIQKYFDLLPKEKVPKIGSVGERYRIRQLNYQLPKQDIDYAYCKHIGLDKECFEEFVTARNEIALDIGYIKECGTNSACTNCEEQINQGELAVNATKFSNRVIWHPRCFQCSVCKELLVDLTYCAFEDKIFCERHYAEIFKPRCNACDELRRVADFRRDNEKIVKDLNPADYKKPFTETDVLNVLIDKDHLGRRIIVLKQGGNWNPDQINVDEIFKLLYLIHIIAQLEKTTQINGVVVIMDFEGLSLKQVKSMTVGATSRLLTFIQEAMPIRLKEVHFVKQSFIFNMVWALIKPFVKEKLKKRMFFHGSDMSKLHKYIPVGSLPKNYGGTLPEINYSGKDWYPCVDKYGKEFIKWNSYGYK